MKRIMIITSLVTLGLAAMAQNKNNHVIRVDVQEFGDDGTHVKLALPLTTLRAFEPMVRETLSEMTVDGHDFNLAEIWQTVKDTGPMDYVEVLQTDRTITVSTTATHVVVRTDGTMQDQIHMSIPFELCDAMFRDAESFDYQHLVDVLEDMAGEDLVNIDTDNERIRIWIE
ncbi:MAG: hypothetical protein KDC35_12765 [Acidobacteria bacterium]|nr:hypothetical protein [Acidobacteriota bacterium]